MLDCVFSILKCDKDIAVQQNLVSLAERITGIKTPALGWPSTECSICLLETGLGIKGISERDKERLNDGICRLLESHDLKVLPPSPDVVAQRDSFERILARFYSVRNVDGDGNCFYRSTIQSLFPEIGEEKDLERLLALILRVESCKLEYDDFPETYKSTLSKEEYYQINGVYQGPKPEEGQYVTGTEVLKAAAYLGREIRVLKYDDPNLSFDRTTRTFLPGEGNFILKGCFPDKPPITVVLRSEHYLAAIDESIPSPCFSDPLKTVCDETCARNDHEMFFRNAVLCYWGLKKRTNKLNEDIGRCWSVSSGKKQELFDVFCDIVNFRVALSNNFPSVFDAKKEKHLSAHISLCHQLCDEDMKSLLRVTEDGETDWFFPRKVGRITELIELIVNKFDKKEGLSNRMKEIFTEGFGVPKPNILDVSSLCSDETDMKSELDKFLSDKTVDTALISIENKVISQHQIEVLLTLFANAVVLNFRHCTFSFEAIFQLVSSNPKVRINLKSCNIPRSMRDSFNNCSVNQESTNWIDG